MFSKFGFMLKTNLFYLAKASNPGEVKHPLCTNHIPAMYQPCPNLDKNNVKLSDPAPPFKKTIQTLECSSEVLHIRVCYFSRHDDATSSQVFFQRI